jgi:hypothetical protein
VDFFRTLYASRDQPLAKPETKNPDLSARAFGLVDFFDFTIA